MIDSRFIGTKELVARYGRCTKTFDRWVDGGHLGFPSPIKIARRKYWDLNDILNWERQLASKVMEAK